MHTCNKCKAYGLQFNRAHKPEEFIEGDPQSPVWIIGINPSEELNWIDNRSIKELKSHFTNRENIHPYFKDFDKVSHSLFSRLGTTGGVAHTDMVKCSSRTFPPPEGKGKKEREIVKNCSGFLKEQIETYKPLMLICNGSRVCEYISKIRHPIELKYESEAQRNAKRTHYWSELDGKPICVVLTGFIGRIDDYSKRRLGIEIEHLITESSIW